MRRNKVLNTLAAASMAAMMAVTAVPATTVLAAPAQESQLGSQYKAVLNTNGTVTVYYNDGTEVPASAVKTTGFGGKYTTDQEVAGQVSVYGQSFDVTLKAAQLPEITVDQLFTGQALTENEGVITNNGGAFKLENAIYAPSFTVKGGKVTSDPYLWRK